MSGWLADWSLPTGLLVQRASRRQAFRARVRRFRFERVLLQLRSLANQRKLVN